MDGVIQDNSNILEGIMALVLIKKDDGKTVKKVKSIAEELEGMRCRGYYQGTDILGTIIEYSEMYGYRVKFDKPVESGWTRRRPVAWSWLPDVTLI